MRKLGYPSDDKSWNSPGFARESAGLWCGTLPLMGEGRCQQQANVLPDSWIAFILTEKSGT